MFYRWNLPADTELCKHWDRVCSATGDVSLWLWGMATGPVERHYQLSGLEGWTWGSQPLTVLYLPGSPLRHGPLSFRSDSTSTDQSQTSTADFSSSLITRPTRHPVFSHVVCSSLVIEGRDSQTDLCRLAVAWWSMFTSWTSPLCSLRVRKLQVFQIEDLVFSVVICYNWSEPPVFMWVPTSSWSLIHVSVSSDLIFLIFCPFAFLHCSAGLVCSEDCESGAGGLPAGWRPN